MIAAFMSKSVAALGIWSWYDRVDTASNPVDGLSRGRLDGPWQLQDISIPPVLLNDISRYVFGTEYTSSQDFNALNNS